jgi:hypothetical protein
MDGFMEAIGPAIEEVIKPLVDMLNNVGRAIAEMVLPVLNAMYPIISTVANILNTLLAPFLSRVSAQMSWLSSVLTILDPILKAFATALEVVQSPLRFVGDLLSWFGRQVRYAAGQLTFWTNADNVANPGAFSSDAFSGLSDRIAAIWAPNQGSFELAPPQTTDVGGVGSSTSIARAPDQYFYFTFEGPVIGEAGKAEVGQFFMQAVQEYAGVGGRVSLEIAGA